MDDFLNHVKAQSAQLDQSSGQPRLALISSVDPTNYTARVLIQPENVLSGWLPIGSSWVGAGWGLVCLPTAGDQVLVLWQEGDAEHGIIVCRLWSSTMMPPQTPVGEFWLQHKSGSFLKLKNDGTIASSAGTWTHIGDFQASGNITDSHGSLESLRSHYDVHIHPSGGAPTPQD